MKRIITVNFKNGNQITVEPKVSGFGLMELGNGLSLNVVKGILYKRTDNVICGEDITDTVDTIKISMQFLESEVETND